MEIAVRLENISRFYGQNHVLAGVSLTLEQGKFYVLLGRNGAGKSTLLRLLMRSEPADGGSGTVLGRALTDVSRWASAGIGYVSESLEYAIPVRLGELFTTLARMFPRWDEPLFDSVLRELKLDRKKAFRELSRGQKMQVAFAIALAQRPKLLLLDEITSVLDANARAFFMKLLVRFVADGGCVLLATNIVTEAQAYADQLILIDGGKVALDTSISSLERRFAKFRRDPREILAPELASRCVDVGLNSDGSISMLVPLDGSEAGFASRYEADHRGITAEDVFIFYTRSSRMEAA